MPERVSRISWRKGRPLALALSPRRGFLDLPPELREKVYRYSLVASEPITVLSVHDGGEDDVYDSLGKCTIRSWKTVEARSALLDHLARNLLLCSRRVSHEAAFTFYSANSFRFLGDQNWNPLFAFLHRIGDENRDSLRSVELRMPQPQRIWQWVDGIRTSSSSGRFLEIIPQSAFFQRKTPPYVEGRVDHLDPAIEACFRILGKSRPPLSIVLWLDCHLLPGLTVLHDPHALENWEFSLDLPVVIEQCRRELTPAPGATSKVEVLWKGECFGDQFTSQTRLIQEKGWVILDTKEKEPHHNGYHKLTVLFTLRRKEDSVASSIKDSERCGQ